MYIFSKLVVKIKKKSIFERNFLCISVRRRGVSPREDAELPPPRGARRHCVEHRDRPRPQSRLLLRHRQVSEEESELDR